MKFSLNGKVALVTGAAGLLGREHCIALAQAGAQVIVSDINQQTIDQALVELKKQAPNGVFHGQVLDVTKESSIQSCLQWIQEKYSKLDILINNAAIDPKVSKDSNALEKSRIENFDLDNWNHQINVGLTGTMLCCKYLGSFMAEKGGGVILNIASDLSVFSPDQRLYRKQGLPEQQQPVKPITYSAIKHGLIGITKYLSTYWADKNIRVNALSPGGVFNGQPKEFVGRLSERIPMGRMAEKNEYHSAVVFLCSEASSYMTGQNIVMDGGRSVW